MSLGDAVWWAVTTVTTVGYGDKFPTTVAGRLVAGGLMLLGIALFGILTASLSSFFLTQTQEDEVAQVHGELKRLREEIRELREALTSRYQGPPS
jgi:voltage-gated potassium channel